MVVVGDFFVEKGDKPWNGKDFLPTGPLGMKFDKMGTTPWPWQTCAVVFHLSPKTGGKGQLYRSLMLERMSLMISLVSGSDLHCFSTRSMEWRMVVWSRLSNSLPMSFRESLVMCRVR